MDSNTVGVIYDQVDGLNFHADYGSLLDLFAHPDLAGRKTAHPATEKKGRLRAYCGMLAVWLTRPGSRSRCRPSRWQS